MSYSFNLRAATPAEAKEKITAELDKVAAAQACHVKDRDQARAVAFAFVDLIEVDASKDISVSMNGWLSGNWVGTDVERVSGACVSVTVGLADKMPP